MSIDTAPPTDTTDADGFTAVDVPDDESLGEQITDALMAIPAALIAALNGGIITGATAFATGGLVGLGATTTVAAGGGGAAVIARRAHQAEARRRAEAAGRPVVKLPRQPRPRRAAAARRTSGGARPAGGLLSGAGRPRPAGAGGGGRRAGAGGGRAGGAGRGTGGLRSLGLPSAGRHGAGKTSGGRATKAGAAGRAAGHRAAGGGPAGGARRSVGRTAAVARRAGGAAGAGIGRGTHAAAGSRAGRAAAGGARRTAAGGRAAGGGLRRAHAAGRAGLAGAATARGRGPAAAARGARAAIRAERARQDRIAARRPSRTVRARRAVTGAGLAGGVAGFTIGRTGAAWFGRWMSWFGRAVAARATGAPIPDPPGWRRPPPAAVPQVSNVVIEGPSHIRATTPGVTMSGTGSTLGLMLTELSGQMAAAATGYDPDGMAQWGADIQALETILGNVAGMMRAIEKGADDLPVEQAVIGTLSTVAGLIEAAASAAAEIHTTFRTIHKDDLDRIENPRTNEAKWDVEANK